MDNEEKEDIINKLDDIIDDINELLNDHDFPVQMDNLIKQARDILNKAQGKL